MAQTITFKDGTVVPVLAVYSNKDLIQGAYRESYEIRFSPEATTYEALLALANSENLSELILTELDEAGEVTARFSHFNFTIVTGMGVKTDPIDGSRYLYLSVAQKSDAEL
ncbi:MAG: hypothetical protein NC084_12500, partial [Bacteroides sp.]|nr:hypothetical protein [Bacteroides sp.]